MLQMTNQEAFNKGYLGVLKQGEKSFGVYSCRYRVDRDGKMLKCFVGHLIEDEDYLPEFEGHGVYAVVQAKAVSGDLSLDLLTYCQAAHDRIQSVENFVQEFKDIMAVVAKRYNLEIPNE